MKVLIACEESQTVCKEFRKLGHEAYSCDIQECSGGHPEWHIKDDVIKIINDSWDLIIAHPPCTYLSKAGARWLYEKKTINHDRLQKGIEAKEFFMKFYNLFGKIAIENPQPMKIFNLPEPNQIIQPYEFGEDYSKKTYLWLKNLPPLFYSNYNKNYTPYLPSNTGGKKRNQSYTFRNITKKQSSKTFQGIARAMAIQWGGQA